MRRYIPALLLVVAAFAPLLGGCEIINKLKGGGGNDADIIEASVVETDAAESPAATETATAPPLAPVPTTTLTPVTPAATATGRPVVVADAGAKADAAVKADAAAPVVDSGAPKTDSGPAPAPTPTFKLPAHIFDAGGLGGLKFDAGGFKLPWQK